MDLPGDSVHEVHQSPPDRTRKRWCSALRPLPKGGGKHQTLNSTTANSKPGGEKKSINYMSTFLYFAENKPSWVSFLTAYAKKKLHIYVSLHPCFENNLNKKKNKDTFYFFQFVKSCTPYI